MMTVTTSYRENSILAIARAAAKTGVLNRFYTTLYLAGLQPAAEKVPVIGERLGAELGRRSFPGIPADNVTSVASLLELLHVGVRRTAGGWCRPAATVLMYAVKARFDSMVAREVRSHPTPVLVGMYASSRDSFRAVHGHGGLAVLNFVNNHPREQNRYLSELAGLPASHHEMIPDWVAGRVEDELDLADLVLVPSRFVARQLVEHGVSQEKIAVIPYGVDLSAFRPGEPSYEKKGGRLECLYVGQISHLKGMRVLLEAARRCRNLPVDFRLIGPFVSAEVLKNLPDNCRYEGISLPGGVAEAMRRADIFVLPTLQDACALVVLEAMSSGLPVITTTNNGSGEIIDDDRDGLIVPAGDASALAGAIHRLVEEPELRFGLGEAARRKVEESYSWETYGEKVLAAIDGLDAEVA